MNADSVKARLKNYALKSGKTFEQALTYYGLERTIYRIFISAYSEHFVLKGGILLYALFNRDYERMTTDIDLLARNISNDSIDMKGIFAKILAQDTDDALVFDTGSINVANITEFKKYHGLHVSAVAYLDRTKIPIGVDIGFGDVVYPDITRMAFPTIINADESEINAYSLESSIAEKLEAIVHNGYLNSRYKDFYDIYVLSQKNDFAYEILRSAVVKTFTNRRTEMTMDSPVFEERFLKDPVHQMRWNGFLKKKKALIRVSMEEVMERIKIFAGPLFYGVRKTKWNSKRGMWES